MKHNHFSRRLLWLLLLFPVFANAQGTQADYDRATGLREKFQGLVVNAPERANWIEKTSHFWYRKSVKGGYEFVLVDAETLVRKPAFDHEKLAAALSAASAQKLTALSLPFTSISFDDSERGVQFVAFGSTWRCDLEIGRASCRARV